MQLPRFLAPLLLTASVGALSLSAAAQDPTPASSSSAPAVAPVPVTPAASSAPTDPRVEQLEKRVDMLEMQVKLLLERIVGTSGRPAPQAAPSGDVATTDDGGQRSGTKPDEAWQNELPLKLVKWSYVTRKGDYSDYYQITYTLRNDYDKPIKLIDGSIGFHDLLGERIYGIKMDKDVKIAPKKEATFKGDYSINQFINQQNRMREMARDDVVAKVDIRKIVFADNSIKSFSN